ncbi:hypothetical protein EYF80_033686 [Liparis tanakae]|uniref:Uncharacterized protein n=1 Tax=Liparis tanakae TaxID=230148 RepID=A0A4Z2GRN2_9TELE|nr:hypothetical protein EYF80_033686 [Liparis tanakae]
MVEVSAGAWSGKTGMQIDVHVGRSVSQRWKEARGRTGGARGEMSETWMETVSGLSSAGTKKMNSDELPGAENEASGPNEAPGPNEVWAVPSPSPPIGRVSCL